MAVREVLRYPNEELKKEAAIIERVDSKIEQVIADLNDTMDSTSHSTGIAAPQIGELYTMILIDASKNKKCTEHHGKVLLINPEIISYSGSVTSREGCMSVPDFTGNVTRAERVTVEYCNKNMELQKIEANGFEAILLQHEIDHLHGILFVDRVISKRNDLFRRKNYK